MRVDSIRSLYRVRGIDAIPRAVVDERELLAGRAGAAARRGARGEAEMLEDLAGDSFIVDERDQAHRAVAPRTGQHVDAEHALEQLRPCEAAPARGVVRAVVARVR